MKRILITLILSIIVFAATIVTTNIYVSKKSTETADYLNDIALDNFRSEMESDILMTEVSIRNFLSGWKSVSVNDSDMIDSVELQVVIDESHLKGFRKGIHGNLCQFMKANRYYAHSTFIIDDEINREYYGQEGYYAPSVKQKDSVIHVLSDSYDYKRSSNFQQVKRERKKLWCAPSANSPVAGKYMTIYVPIVQTDGRFFGAFAVSLDVGMIGEKLKKHLPYGEDYSAIFILDENGRVFASSHQWIKEHQDELKEGISKFTDSDSTANCIRIEYGGVEYYGYKRTTANAPWAICTLCKTDKIYEEANNFRAILFATSFLGMFLILICSYVIFRQIKKNLRLKAAAEDELRMAAQVQTSMLKAGEYSMNHNLEGLDEVKPSSINLNAFMQPAKLAGGDLYDYVEKDGKLIFCIGDVSGKGMPAALFMTQVVSLFRNAVMNTSDPAAISSQINDVLAQNNPDMTFCTFFVGVLHGASLTFCNAGHNPPVFISSQSSPQYLQVKPNIALGLIEDFPYRSETITLQSDDSLLLFTDGVTEAKNRIHNDFGEDRLLSAVSEDNDDVIASVLQSVHSFVGKYEQSDDITMIHITSNGQ